MLAALLLFPLIAPVTGIAALAEKLVEQIRGGLARNGRDN